MMTDAELIEKEFRKWLKGPEWESWLKAATNTLKRERGDIKKLVQQIHDHATADKFVTAARCEGYRQACTDILKAMAQRVKERKG